MLTAEVVDPQRTRELRRAVLRPTWPPGAPMPGDDEPAARHLAAIDGDDVVGAVVLLPHPFPSQPDTPDAWQLRGMAVADGRRNEGIGALLLATAVVELRRCGARLLWCNARLTAVEFYRRHGFRAEGDEFRHEETGLAHLRMWRGLELGTETTSSTM